MGVPTLRLQRRVILTAFLFMLCATGGCKQGPWTLWDAYSARFIDAQGRVIDPQGAGRTTSEGQAYALFFSLADNDRACFDRVLNWTQANLANGDLRTHLPAWLWGKSNQGEWKTLDSNPASDADLWLAYTLLEAGRLWKHPAYTGLGRAVMAQIAKNEVAQLPGFGPALMPGATALFVHNNTWTLNPSYMPLFLFERLASVDPAGPWQAIALGIPRLLRESARHGYAMDWVDYVPGDGFFPAPKSPEKDAAAPAGSYDAIRVYLWAGMQGGSGKLRSDLLDAVPSMAAYLADHDAPPEKVSDQGIPLAQDGPVGFSAAVLPYLKVFPGMERASARQAVRLSKQRDATTGLYGKDSAYYDQNLVMFATGYLDGRFKFGPGGDLIVEWTRS